PYVFTAQPPNPPLPLGFSDNGVATVGSLDSTGDHLTIKLALPDADNHLVSKLPLLGPSWVVGAGTGVLSTVHGDATVGPAVRIYGLTARAAGHTDLCGTAPTPRARPRRVDPLLAAAA